MNKLNEYVVGQDNAKEVLSFCFYLHAIRIGYIKPIIHKMMNAENSIIDDHLPKPNVLLIGPTGSGKSYIINTLCRIFGIPYLKIDCSSLTSSGYVGNDLDSYLRNFHQKYGKLAEKAVIHFDEFDKMSEINYGRNQGSVGGIELQQEFLTMLEGGTRFLSQQRYNQSPMSIDTTNIMFIFSGSFAGIEKVIYSRQNDKELKQKIEDKKQERERVLEIWGNLAKKTQNVGFKPIDNDAEDVHPYKEIENLLREVEIEKVKEFIYKADERGILEDIKMEDEYDVDELMNGVTYEDIINFGIIPELVGRVGHITVLDSLTKEQIIQIMKNSKNSVLNQFKYFFKIHYDTLVIKDEVYDLIAEKVLEREIGARGLNSILLLLIQEFLFEAPDKSQETFVINKAYFALMNKALIKE